MTSESPDRTRTTTTTDTTATTTTHPPVRSGRIAAAGLVGTFIEYFDFVLYGVLTVYFAPQFFPSGNAATSLLASLAVFGVGYFARPIGGLLFGWVGDRYGRKRALVSTLVLMGLCAGATGLLPTYESIGILAPLLLVALRIGQGLSAGAELLGAMTYVLESAPPRKRLFLASLTTMGTPLGSMAATLSVLLLGTAFGQDWLKDDGWRYPFLLAFPLTLVALWIRSRMEDSPVFQQLADQQEIVEAPLVELVRTYKRRILFAGGVAFAAVATGGLNAWFPSYLIGTRELSSNTVLAAHTISYAVSAAGVPFFGMVTARYGKLRTFTVLLVAFAVASPFVLWLLGTGTTFVPIFCGIVVYGVLVAGMAPPAFALVAEVFPPTVRYTGANLGFNIGTVVGAGLAPLTASSLVLAFSSIFGPLVWMLGASVLGLGLLAGLRREASEHDT